MSSGHPSAASGGNPVVSPLLWQWPTPMQLGLIARVSYRLSVGVRGIPGTLPCLASDVAERTARRDGRMALDGFGSTCARAFSQVAECEVHGPLRDSVATNDGEHQRRTGLGEIGSGAPRSGREARVQFATGEQLLGWQRGVCRGRQAGGRCRWAQGEFASKLVSERCGRVTTASIQYVDGPGTRPSPRVPEHHVALVAAARAGMRDESGATSWRSAPSPFLMGCVVCSDGRGVGAMGVVQPAALTTARTAAAQASGMNADRIPVPTGCDFLICSSPESSPPW